ncbi:MAG: peptidoglycan DD-metalloendopeptidase family protein [Nitriliruptorales bacterium]|nr:peptidoglycan DD-metalloendopeptidase family protein [Nitriliruptorales bacterium]
MPQSPRMTAKSPRRMWLSRVTLGLALVSLFFSSVPTPPAHAAGSRPLFQVPFSCGEEWKASTYPGHGGVDWNWGVGADDLGRPVAAAAAGIAHTKYHSGYGYYVDVDHGGGWVTRYAHLLSGGRAEGPVAQGATIGKVGSTGRSTSPHLHWEQRADGVSQSTLYVEGTRVQPDGRTYISRNCPRRNPLLAGDVDGDGDGDIVARFVRRDGTSSVKVLHGSVSGSQDAIVGRRLKPPALPPTAILAVADTTGDGRADLNAAYAHAGGVHLASFKGRRDGTFGRKVSRAFRDRWSFRRLKTLRSGDVDGDGIDDLVVRFVGAEGTTVVRVARGSAGERMRTSTALRASAAALRPGGVITVGDTNGDGRGDLNVAEPRGGGIQIASFYGRPDGTFGGRTRRMSADTWVWKRLKYFGSDDIDGDGVDDLVVRMVRADASSTVTVLRGGSARALSVRAASHLQPSDLPAAAVLTLGDTTADGRSDVNTAHARNTGVAFSTLAGGVTAELTTPRVRFYSGTWDYHRLC